MILIGAIAWMVQPGYVLIELIVAAASTVPYSFGDQTISDLGAVTCTEIVYPAGPVSVCSPLHPLLNGSFVVFGLLIAVGALFLHRALPRGRAILAATVIWVAVGVSTVATGLVPLDVDLGLHSLVALPSLVGAPIALAFLAVGLWASNRALAVGLASAAAVSLLGAVVFLATAASREWGGVWERLGFWPTYLWLPVVAGVLLRSPARSGGFRD